MKKLNDAKNLIKYFAIEEYVLKKLVELKIKLNEPAFDIKDFVSKKGEFI